MDIENEYKNGHRERILKTVIGNGHRERILKMDIENGY